MIVVCALYLGTGKTATFSISILQQIEIDNPQCQALILAPTRELAQQIQKVVIALGDYMSAKCHACIGGTNVKDDIRNLEKGMHVVVGTPGRVYDMIQRRALRTDSIRMFVLDEADEMLSRGFKEQIHDVFKTLSDTTQVMVLDNRFTTVKTFRYRVGKARITSSMFNGLILSLLAFVFLIIIIMYLK